MLLFTMADSHFKLPAVNQLRNEKRPSIKKVSSQPTVKYKAIYLLLIPIQPLHLIQVF